MAASGRSVFTGVLSFCLFGIISFSTAYKTDAAVSTGGSLKVRRPIKIAEHKGQTCLFMMKMTDGVEDGMRAAETVAFKIPSVDEVEKAAEKFDPSVYRKATKDLGKGGLEKLLEVLEGEKVTSLSIVGVIASKLQQLELAKGEEGLTATKLAPFITLASGAGVAVVINKEACCYHTGYKQNPQLQMIKRTKSGRTFAEAGGRKPLDASDVLYLKALANYLQEASAPMKFYESLLRLTLQSNSLGFGKLSSEGQIVAADFYAVYMAELTRHLMTGLTQHPWENDLAEVTFLTAWGIPTGKIMKDGILATGAPVDYFGVSQREKGGSGIGMTRTDRRLLQRRISNVMRKIDPEAVGAVEDFVGKRYGGDLFRAFMEHINEKPDHETTPSEFKKEVLSHQRELAEEAPQLIKAFLGFLKSTHEHADEILRVMETEDKAKEARAVDERRETVGTDDESKAKKSRDKVKAQKLFESQPRRLAG